MISFALVFLGGLIFTISISQNKKVFYENIFYYLFANCYFLLITFFLPSGFADDQYEYFSFIPYDLNDIGSKYQIMKIVSYIPYEFFEFDLMNLRYLFFINYVVVLLFFLKKLNLNSLSLLFLIIMPSIFLHAGLFLREPIVYVFITIFIYAIVKKRLLISVFSFLFILLIRPDTAGLLTPLFIYLVSNKPRIHFFLSIMLVCIYIVLITSTPIETLLSGYRSLFGMPDFGINIRSISRSLFNLLFGSGSFEVATLLIMFESIIAVVIIYKIENKSIIVACWFLGLLLIGSISANSGFIIRTRSALIVTTFIFYFYQKYQKKLLTR